MTNSRGKNYYWDAGKDFYVCPQHTGTGGYESCCNCGGWDRDDPDYGRKCTEALEREEGK